MPYRSPGPGDERVDWILREINIAQQTLDARIAEAQSLPETEPSKAARIARLNQMKREVDNVYGNLDSNVKVWADRDITNFYRRGHSTASAQLSAGYSFTLPHREAVELMSFDAYDDVGTRLQQVRDGFSANVELQKAFESLDPSQLAQLRAESRSAINQMLLTGEDPRKIAKRMADSLWENGVPIIDAGGRQWNPESYTRMLVRTKSANAYNAGSMNKYAEEGVKRVKVFDGVEDDQECAEANGQTWTLDYAMEHVIAHPNCRRAFGPLQGDGPVDNKNVVDKLVKFDRLELVGQSLLALRAFRRTGEINVSSTLARLVIELGEAALGFPIPVVDTFIMQAVGQGFRNADAYVESYIDPVLFAAGFVKDIPTRAQLVAMRTDNPLRTFVDELAENVSRARFDDQGRVSTVGMVLTRLEQIADRADEISESVSPVEGLGAIPWVGYVADEMSQVGRLGQIVGETLVVINRGDIESWRDAWAEATSYVDDMTALREAHQQMLLRQHEQALTEMNEYLVARRELALLLQADTLPENVPLALSGFLDPFRTTEGIQVPLSRVHLIELDERLEQLHYSAFRRAGITRNLARKRESRSLPFPESAGPDFVSEAGTYWTVDEFEDDVVQFVSEIGGVVNPLRAVPRHNINLITDVGEAIQKLSRDEGLAEVVFNGVANFNDLDVFASDFHLRAHPRLIDRMLESGALRDPLAEGLSSAEQQAAREFIDVQKFVRTLGDELAAVTFDRVEGAVLFQGERILLPSLADEIHDAVLWSARAFLQSDVIESAAPTVMAPLLQRISDPTSRVFNVLWQNTANGIRVPADLIRVDPLDRSSFARLLEFTFEGTQRVDGGINGTNYLVKSRSGNVLFVKTFDSDFGPQAPGGGLQGATRSAMSSILHSFLSRTVGEVESPPTRIWSALGGSRWGLVNPGLEDAVPLSQWTENMRVDQARKHAFMDLISGERDGHTGNYMVDTLNETLFKVDNEAGFFKDLEEWYDNAAPRRLRTEMLSAWFDGDDVRLLQNDPPVRLVKLSNDEVEALIPNWTGPTTGDQSIRTKIPVVYRPDGPHLITGRMGSYAYRGRDGRSNPVSQWSPTFFLTDSELAWVLRSRGEKIGDFAQEISRQLDDLDDILVDEWMLELNVRSELDLVDKLATETVDIMEARIDRHINNGVINITGGITEYRGPNIEARIGEKLTWVDESGEESFGTVVNLIERRDGTIHAQVANQIGFGIDLEDLRRIDPIIDVDLSNPATRAIEMETPQPGYAATIRRRIEQVDSDLDSYDDLADDAAIVFESDDLGLLRPAIAQNIQINNTSTAPAMSIRSGRSLIRSGLTEEIANELTKIVKEELSLNTRFGRPVKIQIHAAPIQTDDGKRAFGVFHAESRFLQVSATGLFPNAQLDDMGRIVFDSWDEMADIADYDSFRRVVRHELGHAEAVGRDLRWRSELTRDMYREMIEGHPELRTFEDFTQFAWEQLRNAGRTDMLDQDESEWVSLLIQHRVEVFEDIVHSNRIHAGRMIAENEMETLIALDISPSLIQRLRQGDPTAYHELRAEVFATGETSFRTFTGLTSEAGRAFDLPINIVPSDPRTWDPDRFSLLLQRLLLPDANFVPYYGNQLVDGRYIRGTQRFWEEVRLNTGALTEKGRAGGFTYDIVSEFEPPRGWAVAIKPNERKIENFSELSDKEFARALEEYTAEHQQLLDQPEWFLGGWHDKANDRFVLDTSRVMPDEVTAAHFAFKEDQDAIFNLQTFDEKPVVLKYKNIEEYIDAEIPEYRQLHAGSVDVLKSKNKSRTSLATDGLARSPALSLKALPAARREKFLADLAERKVVERDTGKPIDTSQESIRRRLKNILDRAVEVYEKDPSLREEHRFYMKWNGAFREEAVSTGIPLSRIAGGAAAMSPNLNDALNLELALFMARKLGNDVPLTADEVPGLREYFEGVSKDYIKYASETDDPAKKAEKLAKSEEFAQWADEMVVGRRFSEMSIEQATRVLHHIRREESADGVGFASISFLQFERALGIMRGELEIIDGLGDTKVRSFYNNILDPKNIVGIGDVTIDFHMIDAAVNGSSISGKSYKGTDPKIDGLAWGMRVIIADIVRDLFDEGAGIAVSADSPAELQEVIWHIWRDGKAEGWWGDLPVVKEIRSK